MKSSSWLFALSVGLFTVQPCICSSTGACAQDDCDSISPLGGDEYDETALLQKPWSFAQLDEKHGQKLASKLVSKDATRIQRMHVFLTEFAQTLHNLSSSRAAPGNVDASLQHTFQDIFESNAWRSAESRSGMGSEVAATVGTRACLDSWMTKHNVKLLLDIPCGDGNWQGLIPGIASGAVKYQGYDISPGAVASAKLHNKENENMRFGVLDLVNQVPTEHADMVMIKEVIQHLPLAMGLKMLQNAKAAGIRWLALTSNPLYHNIDIKPGGWFPGPNAQAPPFNFGSETERCGQPGRTGGENDFMLFDLDAWTGS